jgi:hypothetical protein
VVQGEEAGQDLLGGEVSGPAVGGEHGLVEGAMSVFQPGAFAGGTEVVELGEGAVFQISFGNWRLAGCGLRVKPVVAEADEFAGGVGDGFDARVLSFRGFGSRRLRPSGSQAVKLDELVDEFPLTNLAFRDSQNAPPLRTQVCRSFFISCAIPPNFVEPILPISVWNSTTPNASVPEAAVYEDCDLAPRPSKIRLAPYWPLLTVSGKAV